MLAHIPPPRIVFQDGGSISVSKKIVSAVAKDAIATAKDLADTLPGADQPRDSLETMHQLLDAVEDGLEGVETLLVELRAALETLESGEPPPLEEHSPLVEAALTATALASAIRSVDPDAALTEVDDSREALAATVKALEEEVRIVTGRRLRLDALCRRSVGLALAGSQPTQAAIILRAYQPPDHWDLTNVAPSDLPSKAAELIEADAAAERARKAKQRKATTTTVMQEIAALWENADAA